MSNLVDIVKYYTSSREGTSVRAYVLEIDGKETYVMLIRYQQDGKGGEETVFGKVEFGTRSSMEAAFPGQFIPKGKWKKTNEFCGYDALAEEFRAAEKRRIDELLH